MGFQNGKPPPTPCRRLGSVTRKNVLWPFGKDRYTFIPARRPFFCLPLSLNSSCFFWLYSNSKIPASYFFHHASTFIPLGPPVHPVTL